ncbi:hypothetical protein IMZ48_08085 [Candidatus Bathyarchaeota archaeon]|nr:hypothetical protein [Candidatus Bathyarchaeota archaeon]
MRVSRPQHHSPAPKKPVPEADKQHLSIRKSERGPASSAVTPRLRPRGGMPVPRHHIVRRRGRAPTSIMTTDETRPPYAAEGGGGTSPRVTQETKRKSLT